MRRVTRERLVRGAVAGVTLLFGPGTPGNKFLRRELHRATQWLHHLEGRIQKVDYRLSGRHPDQAVMDNVLADRIRSSLGWLERRLELPHVHVTVEHHVALLHGDVATDADAQQVERAVAGVPGVVGVESYLHAPLARGDTRPSEGRAAAHRGGHRARRPRCPGWKRCPVHTASGEPSPASLGIGRGGCEVPGEPVPGQRRGCLKGARLFEEVRGTGHDRQA